MNQKKTILYIATITTIGLCSYYYGAFSHVEPVSAFAATVNSSTASSQVDGAVDITPLPPESLAQWNSLHSAPPASQVQQKSENEQLSAEFSLGSLSHDSGPASRPKPAHPPLPHHHPEGPKHRHRGEHMHPPGGPHGHR